MATYRWAKPLFISKSEVEDIAERAATALGFGVGDDLEPLVARLGGRISYLGFDQVPDGDGEASILIDSDGSFEIRVPAHTSSLRNRFTIAHELGHYFLHFESQKAKHPVKAARDGSKRVEWEANWFAASFLMPRREFEEEWTLHNGAISVVARRFRVSEHAANVRAQALRLG